MYRFFPFSCFVFSFILYFYNLINERSQDRIMHNWFEIISAVIVGIVFLLAVYGGQEEVTKKIKSFFSGKKNASSDGNPQAASPQQAGNGVPRTSAPDLLRTALEQIGAEIETVEGEDAGTDKADSQDEEEFIWAQYQGMHFGFKTSRESPFMTIWLPRWYSVPLDNIDFLSALRQSVNETNSRSAVTVYYEIDKEENEVNVFSRNTVLCIQEIPNFKDYLKAQLNDFFIIRNYFCREMEEMKVKYGISGDGAN